jgi:DNA-directed RNA polymerase subunit RPC12/RpoP
MVLHCINGCGGDRFEALNTPVFVDAGGALIELDASRATYICATCGGVALDIAAAAREMHQREILEPQTLICPACGTEMLAPEDDPLAELLECPICGQRFSSDEGRTRLLGDVRPSGDPELN